MLLKDHRESWRKAIFWAPNSIKYIKLLCITKNYFKKVFFAQIAFLVDSSIHFTCTWYFYPSANNPFSFRDISWWSSNSSFKGSHPVVKRNEKIFYFISFEVLRIRCSSDAKKIALLFFTSLLNKIGITVNLSLFDDASSWSESLSVISKWWIRRKYFFIFCNIGWVDI